MKKRGDVGLGGRNSRREGFLRFGNRGHIVIEYLETDD